MDTITAKAFWDMVLEEERLKRERAILNLQIRALRERMAANRRARAARMKNRTPKSSGRSPKSRLRK